MRVAPGSTAAPAAAGRRPETLVATVAVAAGAALLLLRLELPADPAAPALLLGLTALTAAVALAVPAVGPEPSRLPPGVVLALGMAPMAMVAVGRGPGGPAAGVGVALLLHSSAAVAEEALFRRSLYGALLRAGVLAAVVGSALAFGLLHVPAYGMASLGPNLGAGALLGWQRWASGTWVVPAATHTAANAMAVWT